MVPLILILGLISLPVIIALVFRIHPTLIFTSVLAGFMLTQFLTEDTSLVINTFAAHADTTQYARLGLYITPLLVTFVLARHSGNSKMLALQPVALVSSGLLFAVLLQPLLSHGFQAQFLQTKVGTSLLSARDLVVGVSILTNMLLIWLGKHGGHGSKRKKHH